VARAGFTELVRRVCSGEVGAIFGIEISRLARSNAEVARLMEFAAITETLLIDADGVYDPGDVNDRMLLGMKSTIGEALWRIRHNTSYADHAVMPAMRGKVFAALVFGGMMSA
jgi:DNA invertase Pin-like site-specific DNA recombinase